MQKTNSTVFGAEVGTFPSGVLVQTFVTTVSGGGDLIQSHIVPAGKRHQMMLFTSFNNQKAERVDLIFDPGGGTINGGYFVAGRAREYRIPLGTMVLIGASAIRVRHRDTVAGNTIELNAYVLETDV